MGRGEKLRKDEDSNRRIETGQPGPKNTQKCKLHHRDGPTLRECPLFTSCEPSRAGGGSITSPFKQRPCSEKGAAGTTRSRSFHMPGEGIKASAENIS